MDLPQEQTIVPSPWRRRPPRRMLRWLLTFILGGTTLSGPLAAAPDHSTRVPWTTSRVTGSPDPPPPLKVVRAFPELKFNQPLLLARAPGSDRLYVGEQSGTIYSFANHSDAQAELFFDLRKELQTLHLHPGARGIESLYGLAFHPDFQRNRQCFVCYTLQANDRGVRNLDEGTRVSRFTVTASEPPRIDPASEQIVLTFLQGGHNGGDLHFGPDGMLYISTGDAATPNPPDDLDTGQDISDLLASILRIDIDRQDPGKNYSVPADNPFVAFDGARPEVWAYGFRNPWRMSFDRETGELFVGDVGWELWEMIHRIEKGANYGWSAMEGPQPIRSDQMGPTPIHPALIELPHTVACSVTGGYVYRGKKFPELYGAYVFGDWETRRLWAARFDGSHVAEMPEITRPSVRIVAFGEDRDGELYFLDHDHGTLHTLERNDAAGRNSHFPTTLSATGLFTAVERGAPAAGVVRFQINSRQWQDGATAEYWAAFPDRSFVSYFRDGRPIPGLVYWHQFRMHFPKDAVLLKTLSLGDTRIESQMLHYDGADWHAYTYAWRDDQTDADLVAADGMEKTVHAGNLTQVWQFQSRSQCMSCHSNQSEYALAFLPEQLNRPQPDGKNQLIALTQAEYIRRADENGEYLPPFDAESVADEPQVPDPTDVHRPLAARARGYLHANCGHCHSDHGGGTVPLRLQYSIPLHRMQAIDAPPTRGDFGLPAAAIIRSGEPYCSTLYFRMAKFGRDRMPHIGSELPDEAGLRLIEQWIASMRTAERPSDEGQLIATAMPVESLLHTAESALRAARQLARGELSTAEQDALLTAATRLPTGPVRDLFEGYLPQSEGSERKLGSNPRPSAILGVAGDAARGEQLFWSESVNCGKCHRIGQRGADVGPDLAGIGRLRSKADLLESLVWPSRRIEPKYAAYTVITRDGRVLTGLLIKRDANAIELRDGEGKDVRLAAADVEELRPLRTSLMPDGQAADLTAQQAADLLEFLSTR